MDLSGPRRTREITQTWMSSHRCNVAVCWVALGTCSFIDKTIQDVMMKNLINKINLESNEKSVKDFFCKVFFSATLTSLQHPVIRTQHTPADLANNQTVMPYYSPVRVSPLTFCHLTHQHNEKILCSHRTEQTPSLPNQFLDGRNNILSFCVSHSTGHYSDHRRCLINLNLLEAELNGIPQG